MKLRKTAYYVGNDDPEWGSPAIFTSRRAAKHYLLGFWCHNARGRCPSPKHCMWVQAGYILKIKYTQGQLLQALKSRHLIYDDLPNWVKKI